MIIDAIILAAGNSSRMNFNKLSFKLGEYTLINHTIKVFIDNPLIKNIYLVTDDQRLIGNILQQNKEIILVEGGESRTQSVANALKISTGEFVLIHDGARPFVTDALINRVIDCSIKNNSAVPIVPVTDSIRKKSLNTLNGFVNREDFCFVQTPQGFNGKQLRHAYSLIGSNNYTDDSEVYSIFFNQPFTVRGEVSNRKITFDNDLFGINATVGIGYDLHTLKEGLPFILGGIKIPFEKGFVAHSDGDVLIHSIMDALLSMANQRDIGYHFPDTDDKYKDIPSELLLEQVNTILKAKNININNISSVIIADKPKLSSYIPQMIEKLAGLLNIKTNQISIHATTNEGVDIKGNKEAVAVYTISSGF